MLQLLKVEWMKVKNYRTFWILSALYMVSIFGVNYIVYQIQDARPKKNDMANMLIGTPPFQFPEVWESVGYVSSFLLFIPGLLMIISFTNEFSFKTHRQNIIDGWSRKQFIAVKMVLTIILALVSTLAVFFTALGFGIYEGGHNVTFKNIEFMGYFFVQALSYSAVALLFSLLFKRAAIAVGVYFLYAFILENMLAGLLNRYVNNIGRFLPLESTDNLIPFPFLRNVVKQFTTETNAMVLLAVSAVYLITYFLFSLKKFQRDDL